MQHLDWSSREDSSFLSVFADWKHARDWAMLRLDRSQPHRRPSILIVWPTYSELIGFRVVDLVDKLNIPPLPNFRYTADEYLIFRTIPRASIREQQFI